MKIPPITKQRIEAILEKFTFVKWDRFVYNEDTKEYSIYGWIDRAKDSYKDYIQIDYEGRSGKWYTTTSSVEKHEEIVKIMDLKEGDYNHCQRVEYSFNIKNSIKLT